MATTPSTSLDLIPLRPITNERKESLRLPDGKKSLTRKQQLFCLYYRRGQNCTQAALSAGYSPFTAANASIELLQNPRVQEELARQDNEYLDSIGLDDPTVMIRKTLTVANANIADYIEVQEDGTFKVDLSKASREQLYAIRRISYDPEGRPDIELESREKARDTLIKYTVLKQDAKGNGNGFPTLQALDSIIQKVTNNNVQINIIAKPPDQSLPPISVSPATESVDGCLAVSVGDSNGNDDRSQ